MVQKKIGTTSASFSAKCVDEPRPLGKAKCSAMTESELTDSSDEESSDETGPPLSRASGTTSVAARGADTKSVDEDRPPGSQSAVPQEIPSVSPLTPLEQAELRMLRQFAAVCRREAA